jgi:alkylhydroperoxidase family enzyme
VSLCDRHDFDPVMPDLAGARLRGTGAVRATGDLRKDGVTEERITAVASWRDAPYFTDAERVALELVEAVLTVNPSGERVPEELYARASAHYDTKALWTLTLAIGQMRFFIPVAVIARPIAGQEPHWSK